MAAKDELDLDVQPAPAGKKNLLLYIIIAVLVLALAGLGAAFFLMQGKQEGAEDGDNQVTRVRQAHYLALSKMVVNFPGGAPVRFLQVNMQLMSYEPAALKAVETHMPAIRNDILLLLGMQEYAVVSTAEGKEQLRQQLLEKVQHVLDTYDAGHRIDAIYFTEFIMQ